MKFGEAFSEYLHGEQEHFLRKCSHLEYQQLKKVLETCRHGEMHGPLAESCVESKLLFPSESLEGKNGASEEKEVVNKACSSEGCPVCDKNFFSELMNEVSEIVGCFSTRTQHLLHLHLASGFQRYLWRVRHCFADDHLAMIQEGRSLISYVAMNAIAINKILKKYDKVHCSVNGRNFKTKLQAKHMELLQSPWLIELSAFQINTTGLEHGDFNGVFCEFLYDFSSSEPAITCMLSQAVKLEFSLTCPICLDIVFDPVALGCGHLFCNTCACNAASIPIMEGIKAAKRDAKCPVCRQVGVYADSVHLAELDLLVKKRCKGYWKKRFYAERAERIRQTKEYWDMQRNFALGYI